jgi:hypothetical protein
VGIRSDPKAAPARLQALYTRAGVFLLNTALLFVALNAVLAALYAVRDRQTGAQRRLGRIVARHGLDKVALAYPGWPREELVRLLDESASGFASEYEPFTEFRPRPRSGRYVNISEHGYRHVRNQGPWPPLPSNFNVYVFGGSTTFGFGVPDEEAIPSLVGDRLRDADCGRPLRVYNFGRHAYIAQQEAILFESLLLADRAPDAAVFVDGLNEFYIWPRPVTGDVMRAALVRSQQPAPPRLAEWLDGLPVGRLARGLRARLVPSPPPTAEQLARERPGPEAVIADWARSAQRVERLAKAYGVRTLFVWQPVPFYKYDLSQHLLLDSISQAFMIPARMRRGYELLDGERKRRDPVEHFLWLADIQEGRRENLYLTDMHYRPVLAEQIADRISAALRERGLLACQPAAP